MPTNKIEAILIDSREPAWIQKLTFGGVPCVVMQLERGDIEVVTSDGCRLIIERKTPDDCLNSLKDDRLMVQVAHMAEQRSETVWPYLVITGDLQHDANGRIITERGVTGWDYTSVQGALLSIQEAGVFAVNCKGDGDFEPCIVRLANRKRDVMMNILPARVANVLGPGAAMLAALPGIGSETVMEILRWSGQSPAHALVGLVDLEIKAPLGESYRRKIRGILGLQDKQTLDLWANNNGDMTLKVLEKVE